MDIVKKLTNEFSRQDFTNSREDLDAGELDKYKRIASGYATIENAIAVLSDMHANTSYIYYGDFSDVLGLGKMTDKEDRIGSIWEEEILKLVSPDDLHNKYLHELRFFHFVKHLPKGRRHHYYLANKFNGNSLWLALCLYTPLTVDLPNGSVVVNSVTGETEELEVKNDLKILSDRERQVLRLIDKGLMSKNIAERLSISINTVSRHRQEILSKLQVKNSIEACRIAKDLGLI